MLVSITDVIKAATLREIVASTEEAGNAADTLPEGDNEETESRESVAA